MHKTQPSSSTKALLTQLTLAGAATLAGSAANAQVTVVPVNETIGLSSSFISVLPGTSQFIFFPRAAQTTFFFSHTIHQLGLRGITGSVEFAAIHSGFIDSPYGKKFSTLPGTKFGATYLVGTTHSGFNSFSRLSTQSPTYISFEFAPTPGGPFDYGWLEFSGWSSGGYSPGSFNGNFSVNVVEYAYDTNGAQLPNGVTALGPSVPEPSAAVALAAFSALALGAVGARRLKALKAAA